LARAGKKSPEKDLVITVSGLHGTGKSTHAKRLADTLGLRYLSAGTVFRRMAEERGITLEEMSKMAEDDPEFDKLIDERTKEESVKGGVVVDASLSSWMVEDADIKIHLTSPLKARIRRIAKRDRLTFKEAREATLLREEIERERFKRYYEIDITDLSIYDLILNTELFNSDGTARILKKVVEEYRSCG
jgi:cytidylate kinase